MSNVLHCRGGGHSFILKLMQKFHCVCNYVCMKNLMLAFHNNSPLFWYNCIKYAQKCNMLLRNLMFIGVNVKIAILKQKQNLYSLLQYPWKVSKEINNYLLFLNPSLWKLISFVHFSIHFAY